MAPATPSPCTDCQPEDSPVTINTYIVTVKPKSRLHSGGWSSGEYTVEIVAKDRATAIKRARAGYEDAKVNPATFTARLKPASAE